MNTNRINCGLKHLVGVTLAAVAAFLLAWLVAPVAAAEASERKGSMQTVRESQRILEREGVEAPTGSESARVALPLGTWFLQGVLKSLGSGVADAGLAEIRSALGADRTETMLADMTSTLNGLVGQVEAVATRMEQLFADSQFKNTHRDARVSYDVVDGWARVIEGFERSGNAPSELQLNNIAQGSYAAVASLRGLLVDAETGAIPLILNAYGQKSPVSTGAQQWEEVETYRDHFLAVQALALTNLAWVAEHDDSYAGTYLEPAVEIAHQTQRQTHEITGAPHPQDPGGGAYLHRIGQDWALMSAGRPTLEGEEPAVAEVRGSVLEPKLQTLAGGYRQINGASLADYMAASGFNTWARYIDSYGWSVTCNGSCFAFDVRAWADRGVIEGSSYQRPRDTYINQKVSGNKADLERQLREITANNQANAQANPRFWVAPIETNSYGWAALTDEESIRINRDGLQSLAVDRGNDADVRASFANGGGYEEVRITDARTGEVLQRTKLPASGVVVDGRIAADMVEVEVGHAVSGGGFDSRGGSIVAANPGQDEIGLTLAVGS